MVESGENNGLWPQEDWRIVEEWWKEVLEGWEGRSQSWVFELRVSEVVQAHVWHGSGLLGGVCVQGKIIQGEDASHLRADVEWVICVDADLTRKKVGVGRKKGITLLVGCCLCCVLSQLPTLCILLGLHGTWLILSDHPWIAQCEACFLPLILQHLMAHYMSWCSLSICWIYYFCEASLLETDVLSQTNSVLHGTIVMFQWLRPIDLPILKAVLSRQ